MYLIFNLNSYRYPADGLAIYATPCHPNYLRTAFHTDRTRTLSERQILFLDV